MKKNKSFANLEVSFIKVKGHSGDKYNDLADLEARKALLNK
jgi:ribonuclease HI